MCKPGWQGDDKEPEDERKPEECEFCQFATQRLHRHVARVGRSLEPKVQWVCCLCYSTPAGEALQYPDQFRNEYRLMQMINFMGNTILARIEAKFAELDERAELRRLGLMPPPTRGLL